MTDIASIILEKRDKLVKIVCSDPMRGDCKRAVFRRIEDGNFLLERFVSDKAYHERVGPENFEKCLKTQVIGDFKQYDAFFADETAVILTNKKGTVTVRRKKAETLGEFVHNRKKNYLFKEGEDIPVMRDLGVFTAENKVSAKLSDKYRQINRFIELVEDAVRDESGEITVLDFGCGKSYLTFLLYHYLAVKKCLKTHIIGYDLKKDVVEKCNALKDKYGYTGMEFHVADVKTDKLYDRKIDMVVSLHAYDTATDHALYYAIKKGAKYIFSVPCCQHELCAAISGEGEYSLLLKHGLIKERFSALLTDAIRAEVLENAGYRVDCVEFVGFDASPKNLMLRAVKCGSAGELNKDITKILDKYHAGQTLVALYASGAKEEENG